MFQIRKYKKTFHNISVSIKLTSDNTRRDKPLVNRLRLTYAEKNVIKEILKRDEIILM